MAEKINSKRIWLHLLWAFLIVILVYTRFVNLGWGLPFPMHPDERNMSDAIMKLTCQLPQVKLNLPGEILGKWDIFSWVHITGFDISACFNPHFFAYGQLPLYLGYAVSLFIKFFDSSLGLPIGFTEATLALRFISASASLLTVLILAKAAGLFFENKKTAAMAGMIAAGFAVFAPYAIQFAHFGTTESLLMFFYSLLIYLSLKLMSRKMTGLTFVFSSATIVGMAVATKVSAAVFIVAPLLALFAADHQKIPYPFWYGLTRKALDAFVLVVFAGIVFLFFSPQTLINWNDFMGSMKYESAVALGQYVVFYTRQFVNTVPITFQVEKVFPYVLGTPGAILFLGGFFFLPWSNNKINFLRLSFLAYFLTTAFMFAKWSRFLAPVYPIATLFAVLSVVHVFEKYKFSRLLNILKVAATGIVILSVIIPGIAYLSVYQEKDVRETASDWIYENIPAKSYILSETANVVDIPIPLPGRNADYTVISFDFYELDNNPELQNELQDHLLKADYIFVPSRRVFANHPSELYPVTAKYYDDLLSGRLGFKKVAEFASYPKLSIAGKTLIQFPDEEAEETWTVFDHPVIRIYRKS